MPKHTGLLREFIGPLKVCYDKRNENEGWIPNGHATREEDGFTYSLFLEYKNQGYESEPKADNSDYTKDAQIPLYLGFIEGRGRNNTEKRITPQGIKMYNAIQKGDTYTQYALLIDAFENKTFGRNNQGFPSADSDVEVPNVLILSSILLDGVTRQEFYYIIFLMHTKGWDLARVVAEIIYLRKSGDNPPEPPTVYTDCKLIPLFVSIKFLTEDTQKRLHIAKDVYSAFAERLLRLKSKNEVVIKSNEEQCSEECLVDNVNPSQLIFYGAPGTGKSHKIKELLKDVPKSNIFRTTFHPDSDYSTFVGAYKPTRGIRPLYGLNGGLTIRMNDGKDDLNEEFITYKFIPQSFLNAYMQAYRHPEENVYLVIEEINRGNCAQIFGDLFQLLDRDTNGVSEYSIKADADLRAFLEEELGADNDGIKDGELCLPSNLYIFATMNTSDQSLFPIDSAFKRRWDWEYEPIKYKNSDWKIVIGENEYSWVSFQQTINEKILEANSSEDKMLGDYFVNPSDGVITENVLLNKILFYLWNDVCKDGDGDIFRISENEEATFSQLYGENGKQKLISMMDYLNILKFDNTKDDIDDDSDYEMDNNSNSNGSYDRTRYLFNGDDNNGKGYSKGGIAFKAVEYYCSQRSNLTAKEVMDNWLSLKIIGPNLIETVDVYKERTKDSKDPRLAQKSKILILANGETLYVTNQFVPERINDFINKVNNQDWGITIIEME